VDQYSEIIAVNQAEHDNREYNKATRSRWSGGGFGLEGALKGAATAGALNIATGAFSSIGNSIGNMFSNHAAKKKMERIFSDKNTLIELKKGVWQSVFNVHFAYLDVLEQIKGETYSCYTKSNYDKAKAIHNNLLKLKPTFENAVNPICELIKEYPYSYEFFNTIITMYGDEKNQIEEIGDFFHINVKNIKLDLLDEEVSNIDYSEISDINSTTETISNKAILLGLDKTIYEKKREDIQKEYKNYQRNVYKNMINGIKIEEFENEAKLKEFVVSSANKLNIDKSEYSRDIHALEEKLIKYNYENAHTWIQTNDSTMVQLDYVSELSQFDQLIKTNQSNCIDLVNSILLSAVPLFNR
jgi:hypothetical protein